MMTGEMAYPHVEVAVALVRCGEKILTIYNTNWEAFCLPITKRRRWKDPENPNKEHEEEWADAAGRAACEVLGKTVRLDSLPLHEITDLEYSGRTGEWKHYRVQIFDAPCDSQAAIVDGLTFEWLTAHDLLDENRRPISPTTREVIRQLRGHKKLN